MGWKNAASIASILSVLLAITLAGYRGYSGLERRVDSAELSVSLTDSDIDYLDAKIDDLREDLRGCVREDGDLAKRVRALEDVLNQYRGQKQAEEAK